MDGTVQTLSFPLPSFTLFHRQSNNAGFTFQSWSFAHCSKFFNRRAVIPFKAFHNAEYFVTKTGGKKASNTTEKRNSFWCHDTHTCLMPSAHQSCSVIPFLIWTGGKTCNERLMGWDKDWDITQKLLWWGKQTQGDQFYLLPVTSE